MSMSSEGSQVALSVSSLSASYGANKVLSDVNFEVKAGHTYGLIGLNGVGKTTLIKMALGLKTPDNGEIKIFGRSSQDSMAKSDISYLPERFEPPWFLRGNEFVSFAASLYGRQVANDDMVKMAECLSLRTNALQEKVQGYSKGMRQKLGLIATVLTGCQMLILDEPMSGLDPLARSQVKDMLLQLKSQGKTIILSSHILSDMDEICDRVTVIHGGGAPFVGTPAELKESMDEKYLERAFLKIIKAGM